MGYRANVITQHRAYGSQTFGRWEDFVYKFLPAVEEKGVDITGNEAEDYFEVSKSELQSFVNSLPDNEDTSIYPDCTNSELKRNLQWAIDETTDEFVTWEWF